VEILDRLKSMVGVGAPTIALAELPGPVRSGELLRGAVILQGGDYDAPITDVQVRLDEERLVYTAPGCTERQFWRRLAEVEIRLDERVLRKHERLELSFELIVPADLSPTDTAIGYELFAETEVPGLNPKAELVVIVEA